MKKLVLFLLIGALALPAAAADPLAPLLENDTLAGWKQTAPATTYTPDNVFELINGEAELYFPYGLERVVAVDYAAPDGSDMTVSIEAYELASLLDAFGVFSNYRDEHSDSAGIGAESVAGTTQIVFYQDELFVKARTNKLDQPGRLLAFTKQLSRNLPQNLAPPAELELLNVQGVIPASRQYIAKSLLGYEFFNKGMMAKAHIEEQPDEDTKPLRIFVLRHDIPSQAADTVKKYIAYLDENEAAHEWISSSGEKTLKAQDPLHKGMLMKQKGPFLLGVAKISPETDAGPLLQRLETKLPPQE